MKNIILVLLISLISGCAHLCKPKNENYIKDAKGRIVIYHGVNVSNFSKDSVNGYLPWQVKRDYTKLNDWGFNLVRYLVFWHAIEPIEGVINYTYLDKVVKQVQELQSLGVDVVIDLHQDLYGPQFCGGNGFPVWTARADSEMYSCQVPWSENYLQPAVLACYRNFWNSPEIRGKYINCVELCFSVFDTLSNVVGIDIMNEPFPALPSNVGTLIKKKKFEDIWLAKEVAKDMFRFETKILPVFYDQVRDATVRFKNPIWFEPAIWTSSGISSVLNFNPGSSSVFIPHYYDVQMHEGKPYSSIVAKIMNSSIKATVLNAERFRTPVLIGEFGVPIFAQGYLEYINDFLNLLDQYNIGWVYYTFDKGHPFGILDLNGKETPHMTKLVRVYPQRIAGVNPEYRIVGNKFTLTYDHTLNADTEVFIPSSLKVIIKVNGHIIPYVRGLFCWNVKGKTSLTVEW